MSAVSGILVEVSRCVMTVTIDRPDVLNALDPAAHRALDEAFDAYEADDEMRVAVITGAGERAFCVGSDLKQRAGLTADDMPKTGFGGLTERFTVMKPVIAAVNGHALGGGLELVLASDIAITVEDVRFGLPEPRVGLAASGGLHRLARQIPMKQAMRIALTGQLLDAQTAKAFGLVTDVVARDDLTAATNEVVESILSCAPLSLRATKEMMLNGLDAGGLESAYAQEYPAYDTMLESADAQEGLQAFNEKRPPVWTGR